MPRVGEEAAIGVAVATLWSTPDAVRAADTPTLTARPDVRAWIAAMSPAEQVDSGAVSQALLGERVFVDRLRPDGWARVIALSQPAASLDPRGYPGWLPAVQLAAVPVDGAARLVVDAAVTDLRISPTGPIALPGVVLGTLLSPAGAAVEGSLPVHVPGYPEPLWAPAGHLDAAPSSRPTGKEALAMARRMLDAVYVWGGLSTHGVDCSGLVHLVWRRLGVRLPRDAHEQAAATTPVAPGDERPGDLYFFARPGRRVHHVGFVTTASTRTSRSILHASPVAHRVLEEAMPADRANTLVAAHRV